MVIIDTKTDERYRGKISKAVACLRQGDCDEIITYGADFRCVKHEDEAFGKRVRECSLSRLENSDIRFIIVARGQETSSCLIAGMQFSVDFSHAIFFRQYSQAEAVLQRLKPQLVPEGCVLCIEEYLYRRGNSCSLRIYTDIKGLRTDYGLLTYLRREIAEGRLFVRQDKHDKSFIYLDDLLPYKDTRIELENMEGVAYCRQVSAELFLHDGLIAFDAIANFAQRHPELNIPELHWTTNTSFEKRRCFYDLGEVFFADEEVQAKACEELGLYDWL